MLKPSKILISQINSTTNVDNPNYIESFLNSLKNILLALLGINELNQEEFVMLYHLVTADFQASYDQADIPDFIPSINAELCEDGFIKYSISVHENYQDRCANFISWLKTLIDVSIDEK